MPSRAASDVTQLLMKLDKQPRAASGKTSASGTQKDPRAAVTAKLMPLLYDELRRLAAKFLRQERRGHTLDPTALVHEAFMRMVDQDKVDWQGRTHFLAVSAEVMRRILIDHARAKRRDKRGGKWHRIALEHVVPGLVVTEVDVLELEELLDKLAGLDPRQSKVVTLRIFSGLSMEEIATNLKVSKRTVEGDWTHAKAWLRAQLARSNKSQ